MGVEALFCNRVGKEDRILVRHVAQKDHVLEFPLTLVRSFHIVFKGFSGHQAIPTRAGTLLVLGVSQDLSFYCFFIFVFLSFSPLSQIVSHKTKIYRDK